MSTFAPLPANLPTLPERAGEFKRLFNALSGDELRQIITAKVVEMLSGDRRLANNITFPICDAVLGTTLRDGDE